MVVTQGGSIGINYFVGKYFALTGNYTYNYLDRRNSTDPLIPAFNTPVNKFNLGFNGRDIDARIFGAHIQRTGFNLNYKWIEGFRFEGSPQFTGFVNSYSIVDFQVNHMIKSIHTTIKAGASNILNNKVYQVYGGPLIGRLAYISVLVNLAD